MIQHPDIEALIQECGFMATHSSGKGGQHVNKVSTKVILHFNVLESNVLSVEQKDRIMNVLSTRISKKGILGLSSGRERSQLANRKLVLEKFTRLILQAFENEAERIATQPTEGSKEKRLENKKALSSKKADRARQWDKPDGE